jgi:cell wall-associated NlpC family hydrolase
MTSRLRLRPQPLLACSLLLLSGCAQGMVSLSPSTVISAVIMAGEAIGSSGRSTTRGGSTSSGNAGVRIPRSPAPTAAAARVLGTADQYIGVPYTWGGNTPESGFDCSGFTKFVFARHGIQLPRTAREQARAGQGVAVDLAALAPGDLIMFAEPGEAISHVAMYVGNGRIIHSSSALGGVNYLDLGGDRGAWYVQNMVAARRLMVNGRSLVQGLSYLTIPGLPFDPPERVHAPR